MNVSEWIATWRNEHGYWVAKVRKGEYSTLQSWHPKKKKAINSVVETLQKWWDKHGVA